METRWTTTTRTFDMPPTPKKVETWKAHKDGSSAYKGVSFYKKSMKWRAKILIPGKQIHLGYFISEREAAESYNAAATEHYGDYAKLNIFED